MGAHERLRDSSWLEERYRGEGMSIRDIAKEVGVANFTVHFWLRRHGIETRDPHPEMDERLDDPEWLRKQYVVRGLSLHEIADGLGCSHTTVHNRLVDYGIETRRAGRPSGR